MASDLQVLDEQVALEVLERDYPQYGTIPPFSVNIAEAWTLINKLIHFAPAIFHCGGALVIGETGRPVGGEWGCRFDVSMDGKNDYVIAYGDTAAEAICRAALLCVRALKIKGC